MPDADNNLKGLLAEGTSASEVIAKLEEAGYQVKPPMEDSEDEGGSEASELDASADMPAEELAEKPTEESEEGDEEGKEKKPGGLMLLGAAGRRDAAIDEAMREKGL